MTNCCLCLVAILSWHSVMNKKPNCVCDHVRQLCSDYLRVILGCCDIDLSWFLPSLVLERTLTVVGRLAFATLTIFCICNFVRCWHSKETRCSVL